MYYLLCFIEILYLLQLKRAIFYVGTLLMLSQFIVFIFLVGFRISLLFVLLHTQCSLFLFVCSLSLILQLLSMYFFIVLFQSAVDAACVVQVIGWVSLLFLPPSPSPSTLLLTLFLSSRLSHCFFILRFLKLGLHSLFCFL